MIPFRIQADVRPVCVRRTTASAEKLNLDGARVRLGILDIPPRVRILRHAHIQTLERICVRGAFARVAVATGAVCREDGGFIEVCVG